MSKSSKDGTHFQRYSGYAGTQVDCCGVADAAHPDVRVCVRTHIHTHANAEHLCKHSPLKNNQVGREGDTFRKH